MILIIILFLNMSMIPVFAQTWENEYGRLEVTPTTCYSPTGIYKQYYNITWYYPDNDLDFAFSFNHSLTSGQVYYWNGNNYIEVQNNHITYNDKHFYVVDNIHFEQDESKTGYWEYSSPYKTGKWDLYVKRHSDTWQDAFDSGLYIELCPWFDSDWLYRKTIVLNHSQIPSDLTNFPVNINITDTDLKTYAQSDGDDICFIAQDNITQYNHEIELYNSGTGYLSAWVNVTSLSSSTDTIINMYYGNEDATNQESVTDTWDTHFIGVYHMNSEEHYCYDSTINNNDGTEGVSSNIGFYKTTSVTGYSNQWSGSDDNFFDITSNDYKFTNQDVTVEGWSWETDESDWHRLIAIGDSDASPTLDFSGHNSKDHYIMIYDGTNYDLISDDINTYGNGFHYHVGVVDYTNDDLHIFNDGINVSSSGDVNPYDLDSGITFKAYIGSKQNGDFAMSGYLDEIRISDIKRSDAWIKTTYNNINNNTNGGFYSISLNESYPVCTCSITNMTPVNNSVNINKNTVNLSANVSSSCGLMDYVNISLFDNIGNLINYTNYSSTPVNGTFIHILYNDSLEDLTNYYWNVTASCNGSEIISNTYVFTTVAGGGCDCDTVREILRQELQNYNALKESDNIGIDTTQFVIFIELILFVVFCWLGYDMQDKSDKDEDGNKREFRYMPDRGGLMVFFAGCTFLAFSLSINAYDIPFVSTFFKIIAIIILFQGILKAFYY